jgi:hypothetical protein
MPPELGTQEDRNVPKKGDVTTQECPQKGGQHGPEARLEAG